MGSLHDRLGGPVGAGTDDVNLGPSPVDRTIAFLELRRPEVLELVELIAPAVRIEAALLRRLRLDVLPQLAASAEAAVWFSPLVQAHSPTGFALSVGAAVALRERLRGRWEAGEEGLRRRLEQARSVYTEVHGYLPGALVMEEQMAWDLVMGDTVAIAHNLDRAVASFLTDPDRCRFWIGQATNRLPDVTSAVPAGGRLTDIVSAEPTVDSVWESAYQTLPTRPMGVRHRGIVLDIGEVTGPGSRRIEVPDTRAVTLDLAWGGFGETVAHDGTVVVTDDPVRLPVDGAVEVRVASGERYVVPADPFVRRVRVDDSALADARITEDVWRWPALGARRAEPGEHADFEVVLANGTARLVGADPGQGVQDVTVDMDGPEAPGRLALAIAHISRWLAVAELANKGPAPLVGRIAMSILPASGAAVDVTVLNTSDGPLHVAVLGIWPDLSITGAFGPDGLSVRLERGERWEHAVPLPALTFRGRGRIVGVAAAVVRRSTQPAVPDTWVGSIAEPFDARSLLLPAVGRAEEAPPRATPAVRGLEAVFAWMTGAVDALDEAYDAWLTHDILVDVEPRGTPARHPLEETVGSLRGRHVFVAIAAEPAPLRPERATALLAAHLAERGFDEILPGLAARASADEIRETLDGLANIARERGPAEMLVAYVGGYGRTTPDGLRLLLSDGETLRLSELASLGRTAQNVAVIVDTGAGGTDIFRAIAGEYPADRSLAVVASAGPAPDAAGSALLPPLVDELRVSDRVDEDLGTRINLRLRLTGSDQVAEVRVLGGAPRLPMSAGSMRVEVLPAGHAASLLVEVQLPGRMWRMLFDGGPPGARELVNRLSSAGTHLDLVVASHAQESAVAGIAELLIGTRVGVGEIWFNAPGRHLPPKEHRPSAMLVEAIELRGLPWNREFGGGPVAVEDAGRDTIEVAEGVTVTVLGPTSADKDSTGPTADDDDEKRPPAPDEPRSTDLEELAQRPSRIDTSDVNRQSIAILVEASGTSCLLPGDLPPDRLEPAVRDLARMRGERRLRVDAVVAPHLGSRSSVTESLVESIDSPNWLFTSDGTRYRHPDPEAVARVILGSRFATLHFAYRTAMTERWEDEELRQRHGYRTRYPSEGRAGITVVLPRRRPSEPGYGSSPA